MINRFLLHVYKFITWNLKVEIEKSTAIIKLGQPHSFYYIKIFKSTEVLLVVLCGDNKSRYSLNVESWEFAEESEARYHIYILPKSTQNLRGTLAQMLVYNFIRNSKST